MSDAELDQLVSACFEAFAEGSWNDCIALCRRALASMPNSGVTTKLRRKLAGALRLKEGRTSADLEESVVIYGDLLLNATASSKDATALHTHLGNTHFDLVRSGVSKNANLAKTVFHYEQAIKGQLTGALLRASIVSHLGFALMDLHDGVRKVTLRRARQYLAQALVTFTPEEHPKESRELAEALVSVDRELANLRSPGSESGDLLEPAKEGQIERLRSILDGDVDLESRDEVGCSALHLAASEGHVECATLLVARGADPRAVDDQGFTTLHWAVFSDNPELVDLAYSGDTGLDPRDYLGRTPLSWAVGNEWLMAVDCLLRKGADPNCPDDFGWTPLHHAAGSGRLASIRLLLLAAANRNALSVADETPEKVAERCKQFAAARALRESSN